MKFFLVTVMLATLGCGCWSRKVEERPSSPRAEVQEVFDSLTFGSPQWGRVAPEVTNKLVKLKDVTIPLLLDQIPLLDLQTNQAVEKLGVACGILGTNAYPVLYEVVKGVASLDNFHRCSQSLGVLQIAGPTAFWPQIQFEHSTIDSPNPGLVRENLRKTIERVIQVFPDASIEELIRLYRVTDKSSEIKEYVTLAFQDTIAREDIERLLPIVKSLLSDADPFLALATLDYVVRCGPLASVVKDDVNHLLTASDPQVRPAATNAFNAIMKAP